MADPFNPTISGSTFGLGQATNPWFNVAGQFMPKNLKDVVKWAKFITLHSPTTTEVIRKYSTYPITDFFIESEDARTKQKYEEIIESFRLRQVLSDVGFNYYTIGNVFLSIYFPITRILKCPNCGKDHNIKAVTKLRFKSWTFQAKCPACIYEGTMEHKDTKSLSVKDMNLISWDPLNIATNYNPITGEYDYYYQIPQDVKRKVLLGDPLFIRTLPWPFIEAIRYNQDFKFDRSQIFHLRNVSTGHLVEGVAIPPIISLFDLIFYQASLRKANESIALEYLTPLRVLFPTGQTGNGDPIVAQSMQRFVSTMSQNLKMHKRDRNHIMLAPMPIGYQNLGGDGRSLLVAQEIAQAEETILLALGVSRELLSGTTNWTSSTVGLRLLENTLNGLVLQLHDLLEWVFKMVSRYLGIPYCDVTLKPFKLSDDDSLKNFLGSMAGSGDASKSSLFEAFGLDYEEEQQKTIKDNVVKARTEIENQFAVAKSQFVAAKDIGNKMKDEGEYTEGLSKAQAVAEELYTAEEGARRSALHQLKTSDYATYLMVSKLLEEYKSSSEHREEVQQEGQAIAADANSGEAVAEQGTQGNQSAPSA